MSFPFGLNQTNPDLFDSSATQFQPTSARRAYPCWDEPALKATFNLTMISEPDTVNLSNMDVRREHPATERVILENGTTIYTNWTWTDFHQTPLVRLVLLPSVALRSTILTRLSLFFSTRCRRTFSPSLTESSSTDPQASPASLRTRRSHFGSTVSRVSLFLFRFLSSLPVFPLTLTTSAHFYFSYQRHHRSNRLRS